MATLWVKDVPDRLYAKLTETAASQDMSVDDLVVLSLRRHLPTQAMERWVGALRDASQGTISRAIDIEALMDEVRGPSPDGYTTGWTDDS